MPRIDRLQILRNDETRDGWARFTPHRERVTALLEEVATGTDGTLCVLGAGNCNDLALAQLVQRYRRIDLVDLDENALRSGLAKQNPPPGRLEICSGTDVTGVTHIMSEWMPELPASDEQVDRCIAAASALKTSFRPNSYSVAASVCLLSQLVESITLTLGENHPRFVELMTCIRREHLRRLASLTAPGGSVVLIVDVVSSQTLPQLAAVSLTKLPALLSRAISNRNFFSGMNPFVIKRLLETDEILATNLTGVRLSNPWVWDLGPRRYAVCALTAKRM